MGYRVTRWRDGDGWDLRPQWLGDWETSTLETALQSIQREPVVPREFFTVTLGGLIIQTVRAERLRESVLSAVVVGIGLVGCAALVLAAIW